MKRIVFSLMMVLAAGVCFGQQTVIVPPCVNRGSGISANDIATLTDLIINAIQRQGRFDVPDREALSIMTTELKFQMSDWSDDTKSIQIGKALNANYIARSILASLGDGVNLLTVRIVDINTTKILGRAAELEFTTLRDARGKMDTFLKEVTSNITTDYDRARAQQARQRSELEQSRQAEQAQQAEQRAKLDADWTNKRWFLGFSAGAQFGRYEYYNSNVSGMSSFLGGGGTLVFKSELDIAKYFAMDFDVGLAIISPDFGPVGPCVKILAHIPIRFDFGLDLGVLGGIYGGMPHFFGLAEGLSVGCRIGKGELFAELVFLQTLINSPMTGIGGAIGYKVGLGHRK
jgi:hypothetical protein